MQFDIGYPWCRACGEHHRPPECAVDTQGRGLASCGCPWDDIFSDTGHTCPAATEEPGDGTWR